MAKSRMFNREIIGTNTFLDLPNESKLLYFYFGLNADDDGFISNPKMIQGMLGGIEDKYIEDLISKGYIISFNDESLYVIAHWKVHNHIPPTKRTETLYQEEKQHLFLDKNKVYHFSECIKEECTSDTQIRIDKSSKDKNRIDKSSKGEGKTGKRKKGESEREEGEPHILNVPDAYHMLESIGKASVDGLLLDQFQKAHIVQILGKSDKELGEQLETLRSTLEGSKITTDEFISIIERLFD